MLPHLAFHRLLPLAPSGQLFTDVLPWLLMLVGLVIVGAVFIYAARRMLRSSGSSSASAGFTLQGLRELHAAGELSTEEYERARTAMIGQVRKDAQPEAPDKSKRQEAKDSHETDDADNQSTERPSPSDSPENGAK